MGYTYRGTSTALVGLSMFKRDWALVLVVSSLLVSITQLKTRAATAQSPPHRGSTQLSPQELFKRVSRSVFIVEALDSEGSVTAFGSGVVVQRSAKGAAPEEPPADYSSRDSDRIVTSQHVIVDAASLRVRRGDKIWATVISRCDAERDLCQLNVPGLHASPVPARLSTTLQVGERVYAVGAPEGLELTFSEGVISGLRESYGHGRVIQTTAPLSHGSSGGGLFDAQGRLVGITSFVLKEGQNLNFAVPAEWALSLDARPRAVKSRETSRGTEDLVEAARDAVHRRPNDAEAHFLLGSSLLLEKLDVSGAITELRRALELDPSDEQAHRTLGEALWRAGDLNGARAELRAALKLDSTDPEAHWLMGNALSEGGDWLKAMSEYRQAVRLAPKNLLYRDDLAYALTRADDLDGATKEYREAIHLQCVETRTEWGKYFCASEHTLLGDVLREKGNMDEAVSEYLVALRLGSSLAAAHYGIGLVLLKKGDMNGALAELQQAVQLDSDSPGKHNALCLAMEKKGMVKEALAECRTAYLLGANNAEIRANYERLLRKDRE